MDNLSLLRTAVEKFKVAAVAPPAECAHEETEGGVCADCGAQLEIYYFVDQPGFSMPRPKKPICTIYSEIPTYVNQNVKNLTVEIYKKVTEGKIFRNVFRKAIVLACLHRASIVLDCPIYFDEMLELFALKTHDANKGISFVSNNLRYDAAYAIPFCNDEICLESVLTAIGLKSAATDVRNVFNVICEESALLNSSHCKSVVCGCAYFHVRYTNVPISVAQLSELCSVAKSTICKKYVTVFKILLKKCMRRAYSYLLTNAKCATESNHRAPDGGILYDVDEKIRVSDWNWPSRVSAVADDGFVYELDDVDDVLDWNILLNKSYYDFEGNVRKLNVKMSETTKGIVFHFADAVDDKWIRKAINELVGYDEGAGHLDVAKLNRQPVPRSSR